MKHGYLDESGDVAYTETAGSNLIVAVVVVEHPEGLRKAITKTRKSLRKGLRNIPELKAADSDPRLIRKLLAHASGIGFEAVAVILDKRKAERPEDPEDLYRQACARVAKEAVERLGPLTQTLDRRYTKVALRKRLSQAIKAYAGGPGGIQEIHHRDSKQERLLQIADVVAWSLFQKHENGDETFWEIIQESVAEVKI